MDQHHQLAPGALTIGGVNQQLDEAAQPGLPLEVESAVHAPDPDAARDVNDLNMQRADQTLIRPRELLRHIGSFPKTQATSGADETPSRPRARRSAGAITPPRMPVSILAAAHRSPKR